MTRRDPFEVIQDNDPAASLFAEPDEGLLARIIERPPPQHRRRRLIAVTAVIAILAAVLAAGGIYFNRPPETLSVTCYSDTSLDGDRYGTESDGTPSAADCDHAWRSGFVTNPSVPVGDVPPLTACVNSQGGLAVFPTNDTDICERLGLASPVPSANQGQLRVIAQVRDELSVFITSSPCHPIADAEAKAREVLDSHGLADWRVVVRRDRDDPCGSYAYDIPTRTIMVVPNLPAP